MGLMKKSKQYRGRRPLQALLLLVLTAMGGLFLSFAQPAFADETYKVAVLPEYLEIIIYNRYNGLISYLESQTGKKFELVIPRDFKEHMEMIKKGKVAFSYQNPCVFLKIWPKCQPLLLTEKIKEWGIESHGVIITNKSSGIRNIDDLEGKKVSIVSYLSAEGFISQKNYLSGMMIDVNSDLKLKESVKSFHEEVFVDVMNKKADAGFLSEEAFLDLKGAGSSFSKEEKERIRVLKETSYVPNWIFSAVKGVRQDIVDEVAEALLNIPLDDRLLKTACIRRFVVVPSNYLEEFSSKIERK